MSSASLQAALRALHYIFPILILAYYFITQSIFICTLRGFRSQDHNIQYKRLVVVQAAVLVLYTIELLQLVFETLLNHSASASPDSIIYALFGVFIWSLLTATLVETGDKVVWYSLWGSWIIAVVTETILFGLEISSTTPFKHEAPTQILYIRTFLQVLRLALLILLLLFYFQKCRSYPLQDDEESTSLLASAATVSVEGLHRGSSTYGSVETACSKPLNGGNETPENGKQDQMNKSHLHTTEQPGNWINSLRQFSVFVPLLWPTRNNRVQLGILGVFICLSVGRVVRLLMPRQLGMIMDSLVEIPGFGFTSLVLQMLPLLLYRFLAPNSAIGDLERIFWLPYEQFAARSIKFAVHEKVLSLSRDFQTQKPTSEITRSIEEGATVIKLFRKMTCLMLPSMLDILLSEIYLSYVFGTYVALVLCVTSTLYAWILTHSATHCVNAYREILKRERNEAQIVCESMREWDTVTHFAGQTRETDRLLAAVNSRHSAESRLSWHVFQSNVSEEVVKQLGFAVVNALVIYQILQGTQTSGSFAMMIVYFINAEHELQLLTAVGSSCLSYLVEAEKLRDLLLAKSLVRDGRKSFKLVEGAILFDNINFGYDNNKATIKNFSFSAEAGQHIALVGATGAGKTTVLRLLFRFYDVQGGKIMIDGQDIRDVTLSTLRNAMGVIPQDPSLLDTSIMENVRYSRHGATDEAVIEACKAAAIHEQILTYTDGYQTTVGEHSVKLSKGEKQRIAIARVMLKNPKILLVEEATSSIDSETDSSTRSAIQRLMNGRTTFTIAHRLTTIKDSDVILVMKDGSIIEQGSPSELLQGNSRFSKLRNKELETKENGLPDGTPASHKSPFNKQNAPTISRHISELSESPFRADAPAFVPHQQRMNEKRHEHTSQDHLGESHHLKSRGAANPASKHNVSTQKNDRGLFKRADSPRDNKRSKPVDVSKAMLDPVNTNASPAEGDSECTGQVVEALPANQPLPQLNHWRGRRQARSEPHDSTIDSSQADGTSGDLRSNQICITAASRRVSGPGVYPAEAPVMKRSDQLANSVKPPMQKANRKRKRQFRIKKAGTSDSGSGATLGKSSLARSSNSHLSSMAETPLSILNNE